MPWFGWAGSAVLCWATANTVDEKVKAHLKEARTPLIMIGAISALIIPVVIIAADVQRMSLLATGMGLTSGFAYTFMQLYYFKAVEKADNISSVVPLYCLVPVLVGGAGWLIFDERFDDLTYLGIALIIGGACWLKAKPLQEMLQDRGLRYILCAVAFSAVCQTIPMWLLNTYSYWTVYAYSRIGSVLSIIPIAWFYRAEIVDMVTRRRYGMLGVVAGTSCCHLAGSVFSLLAITLGPLTLVTAVVQSQHILVLGITVVMSKYMSELFPKPEKKDLLQKLRPILMMCTGVVLVT